MHRACHALDAVLFQEVMRHAAAPIASAREIIAAYVILHPLTFRIDKERKRPPRRSPLLEVKESASPLTPPC
jgi:hypothetical protein